MPVYIYSCPKCNREVEIVHSIKECEVGRRCVACNDKMSRKINTPHIEGSHVYPFNLWNVRLPNGQQSVEVRNKSEHKKILKDRKMDSPFFHVGG